MRNIKYKGKSIEMSTLNQWIYGDLIHAKDNNNKTCIFIIPHDETSIGIEVDPETVGQFTELHDKNKASIYEKDILECNDVVGYVEFKDGSYQLIYPTNQGSNILNQERLNRFKLIGNIIDDKDFYKSLL
jgi:hypothetical protein